MINARRFLSYHKGTRFAVFFLCMVLLVLAIIFLHQYTRPYLLKVSFYDIGQGDAIFIETPERYQILIDGGPGPAILREISRDMPFYDRTIDLIIPTHPDADHISGLIDVLKNYQVSYALLARILGNTTTYTRFLDELTREGLATRQAIRGDKPLDVQLPGNVTLTILHPRQGVDYGSDNEAGIATLLTYGEVEFLFLADIAKEQERQLLADLSQGIEVIKIAHHGSKTSSDPEFLQAISPELAIIQVGKDNRYGHPATEVIHTIQKTGAKIWRTDLHGALTLMSDGKTYWRN